MTMLRYPFSALITDYALGVMSTAICLVIVVTAGGTGILGGLFIALTLLCLAYTIRTVLQHRTVIGVDDQGITRDLFGRTRRIDWSRLQGLSLRYYPRKRAKKKGMGSVLGRLGRRGFENRPSEEDRPRSPFADGWMELTLRGDDRQRVTIESSLPQFFELTERAAQAARDNDIELDPVSDDNLQALSSIPPELRTHDPFTLATDRPATTGARTTIAAAKSSDASRHGSNSQAGS